SRSHEALGQLPLLVQRLLGASKRALETHVFRALACGLLLCLLADRLELPAGLLSLLLLLGVVLGHGLAEGGGLRLGGGPSRSAAGQVVARLRERRLGLRAPVHRAPPGVE